MKLEKSRLLTHIVNFLTIALIVECFLCSMMLVNKFGREHCLERIEESTQQVNQMFVHSLNESQNNLTVFADILAANASNPEDLVQTYMENFCTTQDFSAVCIHRKNGTVLSHGEHPHDQVLLPEFSKEVKRLPYVSSVYGTGDAPEDNFIYIAVPVIRSGETIAVLYGYIPLSMFPHFISSTAFSGQGQYYIIDGDTGDFLIDEYHDKLLNMYDDAISGRKTMQGYSEAEMQEGIHTGESGFYVFASQRTGEWYYTYYMPMGINNWSMQMTIDEPSAFAEYHNMNRTLMVLASAVIVLMVVHVLVLMHQEQRNKEKDRKNLHISNYISDVERALINAHSNPDYVDQALKLVAKEVKAETVLLISFSEKTISNVQFWPSKDKASASHLMGRNIRDEFPTLFDVLCSGESVVYDGSHSALAELSGSAQSVFADLEVSNMILVPILDNVGALKGALAAANMEGNELSSEMLDAVTYDFFMAITNRENHAIIKRMGEVDYLTNVKNRNSFEAELPNYATWDCKSLWCVFIDVNGLHEINNSQGHKAGDVMLCAVADAVKQVFGETHTYRMGGDEFVAFAPDSTTEIFQRKKKAIIAELAAKGYYVSVGFQGIEKGPSGLFDVQKIISEAEAIMYKEKWEYYQTNNIPSERGHFPTMQQQL